MITIIQIILFTTCVCLMCTLSWIKDRRKNHNLFKQLNIKYIEPHLIHGSNHQLRTEDKASIDVFGSWIREYGNLFGYYSGGKPFLVVSDLDLVKEILVKNFHNFVNRPKIDLNITPVPHTLVGLRDQRWKDVRSILSQTFSMRKMKLMTDTMNQKVDLLIEIIREKCPSNLDVNWYNTYQALTFDVICSCAFAMKSNCQRLLKKDELFSEVNIFLKNALSPVVRLSICFPTFGVVLAYIANYLAQSGRATQIIISHLKSVIQGKRNTLNPSTETPLDILDLMLESSEKNTKNPNILKPRLKDRINLTDDEIIANAWVFLLGGFETTSTTLTYTSYALATHPDVQEKCYEEIIQKIKNPKENVTYEDVTKLTYLDQVLSEALRLYPPVVTFVIREASSDITIGDLFIPKDMNVIVPIWQIHRDPEQWPDPEIFDPERFSHEAKLNNKRHPMSYLPFGGGPRNCIGMRFAQLEAKLTLARVLANFRLEPCENTPEELRFTVPTVTINPVDDIIMRAVPRE